MGMTMKGYTYDEMDIIRLAVRGEVDLEDYTLLYTKVLATLQALKVNLYGDDEDIYDLVMDELDWLLEKHDFLNNLG